MLAITIRTAWYFRHGLLIHSANSRPTTGRRSTVTWLRKYADRGSVSLAVMANFIAFSFLFVDNEPTERSNGASCILRSAKRSAKIRKEFLLDLGWPLGILSFLLFLPAAFSLFRPFFYLSSFRHHHFTSFRNSEVKPSGINS